MDQRERINDFEEAIRLTIRAALLEVQTNLPCEIVSITDGGMTVTVQPLIRALLPETIPPAILAGIANIITDAQGNNWVNLPPLIHCPIIFLCGGDWVLTFPIAIGDEALVIFSSRAIDNWWQNGGIQNPIELRAHSLDDGFVLVGPKSMPNAISDISAAGPELRSLDGLTKIGLSTTGGGTCSITAPNGLWVNGVKVVVP